MTIGIVTVSLCFLTSGPVDLTSPPDSVTSGPVDPTSPPDSVTSGPVDLTSPPDSLTSGPVDPTSPPDSVTSGPVDPTTPPDSVTSGPCALRTRVGKHCFKHFRTGPAVPYCGKHSHPNVSTCLDHTKNVTVLLKTSSL
uniref:Uncharacterized protein n=1 Tax=Xiphophorus maculatus TaxID=8083 RepID=A0A3B5PTF8_XIPMA